MPLKPQIVFILGMHRSGTSAITRALASLGAHTGTNLICANEHNPHGYFEDLDFVRINNLLLEALGRKWHETIRINNDHLEDVMRSPYMDEAIEFLRGHMENHSLAVLKDPRLCLLAPFWLRVCEKAGVEPSFVLAIRNPKAVARSLFVRDIIPPAKSGWVWLDYTISALLGTANQKRMLVDYDLLLTQPADELHRIAIYVLGPSVASVSAAAVGELFDQSLNHGRNPEQPLPGFDPAQVPGLAVKLHTLLVPAARPEGDLGSIMHAIQEIADQFNSVADIGLIVRGLEQTVNDLNVRITQSVAERERLARRVVSLENSLSWRLTKGPRWLADHSRLLPLWRWLSG